MLRTTPVVVDEPHNTPLQFLSETGIVGFLLYLGVAGGALWGAWRARRRPRGARARARRRRLLRARDRRQGLELRRLVRAALPRRGRARRAAGGGALRRVAACSLRLAVAVALAGVYSLAAPWLAERQLASATTVAQT